MFTTESEYPLMQRLIDDWGYVSDIYVVDGVLTANIILDLTEASTDYRDGEQKYVLLFFDGDLNAVPILWRPWESVRTWGVWTIEIIDETLNDFYNNRYDGGPLFMAVIPLIE